MKRDYNSLKTEVVVGLDMGGANIRTAAVSREGEVLLILRGPARTDDGLPIEMFEIAGRYFGIVVAATRIWNCKGCRT